MSRFLRLVTRPSFPLLVYLAALLLRLTPILLAPHIGIGLDDMFQYDMLARSIAAGDGFRWYGAADLAKLAPFLKLDPATLNLDPRGVLTTFRAPLYPLFLSFFYWLFGAGPDRFLSIRIAQAAIGAVLAPLTYTAARSIVQGTSFDEDQTVSAARAAAIVVAIYPSLIMYPMALATENLFIPLVLAAFAVLLHLIPRDHAPTTAESDHPQLGRAALAGLLLGLAALTRSIILPFAVLAIIWIAVALHKSREALLAALLLAFTIQPWIVRNSVLSGRLTGIETSMGYNLYLGYHPASDGTFKFGPSLDLLSILDDHVRDEVGTERALDFIRQAPWRFPALALSRLGHFFDVEWRAFIYFYGNGFLGVIPPLPLGAALVLLALPFMAIVVSASFGAFVLPRGPATSLLVLLVVAYLLPHVFILSEERFHLTLIPVVATVAAAAWVYDFTGWGGVPQRLATARIIAALFVLNWVYQIVRLWPTLLALMRPAGNQIHLPY